MNRKAVIKLFSDFVAIESVSTDPTRYSEIVKATNFLKSYLEKIGCQVDVFKKNNYPPLIIGKLKGKGDKTIGIYGHYDVQPEDPVDEWKTPPFKLTLKNGRFYGRGVADNKGHVIQNIVAINKLIETKKLRNNIIFIFEGEEESGSDSFEYFADRIKEKLSKIDVFYLTDTGAANKKVPQIFYGLRGIIYFELKVKIGIRDLHSGVYGNRVYNPIQVVADLISKIKHHNSNRIKIPKFYDHVRTLTAEEIKTLKKTIKSVNHLKLTAGVHKIVMFDNIEPGIASKIYPSFEVNGITSGFVHAGQKTIIPRQALVKFSFRLVEHQDPDEIEKLVANFVRTNIPQGVRFELITLGKSAPFYTDINNRYLITTKKILEKEFNQLCLLNRSGGSVPAAEVLQRILKKPVILTGFTLPDDNIHAPNENFDEEMFWKGIKVFEKIYSQ